MPDQLRTASEPQPAYGAQLPLNLGFRPALDRDDFLVTGCNEAAISYIDCWPNWSHYAVLITGPEGSGKSHLANVWRQQSAARMLAPGRILATDLHNAPDLTGVVIEDVDRTEIDEQALFHLFNLARSNGFHLLLTARTPPGCWQMQLPDLISRIQATPSLTIGTPDDALLEAVLVKQFTDRQLWVEPHIVKYLCSRMERSMADIGHLVDAIDKAALAAKRKVTRQLVADVLQNRAPNKMI